MIDLSYMEYPISPVPLTEFPSPLLEIPEPPKQLFIRGNLPPSHLTCLAVVGSRNFSNYGKEVVDYLIGGLRGYPVAIISGLALGIDALAHTKALEAGLYTLAVPGSGLEDSVLYPRRNRTLAMRILASGGGLLSEYEPDFEATPWSFPARNRIMAGLSSAVLIIEASEKSGTLITARLTVDYNRELLVVPGNIFSENSKGPHQFLKLGATPVTSPDDILEALYIEKIPQSVGSDPRTPEEETILDALDTPLDRDALIRALSLSAQETNVLLMGLELRGHIRESNGIFYKI
jgi:DNA processing protein